MAPADEQYPSDLPRGTRRARREAEQSAPGSQPAFFPSTTRRPSPYEQATPHGEQVASPYAPGMSARVSSPYDRARSVEPYDRSASPVTPAGGQAAPLTRRAARQAEQITPERARTRSGRRPRGPVPAGRSRRGPKLSGRQKSIAIAAAASAAVTIAVNVAAGGSGQTPMTRASFSSAGTGAWLNDTVLATTASSDQYAQATVSGLSDGTHDAGFAMRFGGRQNQVLVAVSGTGWEIEPSGAPAVHGSFPHASSGLFRVEVAGQAVRVLWNGALVTAQSLQGQYAGRGVVATLWQSSPTVRMTQLEASSMTPDDMGDATMSPSGGSSSPTDTGATGSTSASPKASHRPSPSPSASLSSTPARHAVTAAGRRAGRTGWLSGASGDDLADGGFDQWRGTPATIAGTWDDTDATVQQALYSICGGQYSLGRWNRSLDIAIGAIFENQGETWAAAADGAYNDRWRTVLTAAKQCWGNRDPSMLFIRFGHEMNLSSSNWGVQAGQESDFTRAFVQFSDVRYQVFPGVQLVLSVNDGSSGGMADVRKLFPGKDAQGRPTANVYGVDSYNAWPHCTTVSDCQTKFDATADNGAPLGIEKHRELAQQMGLPFSIDEYSNNADGSGGGGGGEAPAFFQAFYDWAKAHSGNVNAPRPGQMLYDILFNEWNQYELSPSTEQPETAAAYRSLPWGED